MGHKCYRTVLVVHTGSKTKKIPHLHLAPKGDVTNPQHSFRLLWLKVPGVTALNVQSDQGTLYTQYSFVYVMGITVGYWLPYDCEKDFIPNGKTYSSALFFFQTLAGNKIFLCIPRLLVVQLKSEVNAFCSHCFQTVSFKPYWKSSIFIFCRFVFLKT